MTFPQDMSKFAVVIVDMWDRHWCRTATYRISEIVERVNQFVTEARNRKAMIIHAPSDTVNKYYATFPQRQNARNAAHVPIPGHQEPSIAVPLIVDNLPSIGNGGCQDSPHCHVDDICWTRENHGINLEADDFISESKQEMWNLFKRQGSERDSVIFVGVHLNMCMLWTREFSMKFWASTLNGTSPAQPMVKTYFVRDLTDTMYTPTSHPYLDHFAANDLVRSYIEETTWASSIDSSDLIGGDPFRFSGDLRPELSWERVRFRCVDGGNGEFSGHSKRWLTRVSDRGLGLVENESEASAWDCMRLGRSLYRFSVGSQLYLDGAPNGYDVALTPDFRSHTGTRWYVEKVGAGSTTGSDTAPFYLHCCGEKGNANYLSGAPASGTVGMRAQPASLHGPRWAVYPVR